MRKVMGWLVVGAAVAAATGIPTRSFAKDKMSTHQQTPQRTRRKQGKNEGEEKTKPYPFVIQVDADSDAKSKGIRQGDELIRFDNEETTNGLTHIFDRVNKMRPGSDVGLWIRRGSQTLQFQVRVPKDPGAAGSDKPSDKSTKETKSKDKDKDKNSDDQASTDDKKNSKKKKSPVIIKPIPSGDQQ